MPSNKLFEAIRNLFLDFEFFIGDFEFFIGDFEFFIGGVKIFWLFEFK